MRLHADVMVGQQHARHRKIDACRMLLQIAHDDRIKRVNALDHHNLVLVELHRAVVAMRGARFEIKARHHDLLARHQTRRVVAEQIQIHALRTFEVIDAVFLVKRNVVGARGTVIIVHRDHVRVNARQLENAAQTVVRGGLAR